MWLGILAPYWIDPRIACVVAGQGSDSTWLTVRRWPTGRCPVGHPGRSESGVGDLTSERRVLAQRQFWGQGAAHPDELRTAHIASVSTPQITARQAVAAFDATRIGAARSEGHPVPRCAVPTALRRDSVAPDGSTAVFFWLQRRTLLQAGVNRPADAATVPNIADAVTAPGAVAVPVNPAARRAMEDVLRRGATAVTSETTERVRHAGRIVQYAGAAAMSSRVVVLTAVLARKFYLAGDTGDIRGWRRAFGLGPGPSAMAEMLAGTYRDDTGRRYSNQARDPFRAMLLAEETAVEALRHSYTSRAATAWKAAEKIGEAWDSAARTDVLLRHRHLLDGSVVRAEPIAAGRDQVDALLSLPVRIKAGKVVVMPNDDHTPDVGYATLTGLSMTGDDLTASFTEQKGAVRSFAMLRDAAVAHTGVLVTTEPFLGSTPRVYGGRWGSRTTPPPPPDSAVAPRRQVPLDVVLAGSE